MKELIARIIQEQTNLGRGEILDLIEIPKDSSLGDYAFPCFALSKIQKKSPAEIAKNLSSKIKSEEFERINAVGPYVNFFLNRKNLAIKILEKIQKEKDKYGSSTEGKGKNIVIDCSSPNIAKPFGIGHLRSTIIGNSIAKTSKFLGYKAIKINYLGDWGTQFGKLIEAYKLWGKPQELKKNAINHLQKLYERANQDDSLDEKARGWFKKLEDGDKEAVKLWKLFKEMSIKEFDKIYKELNVSFEVISGESFYNNKMGETIKQLEKKGLLENSESAKIIDLNDFGLGICLIQKSDGATLYATRDLTAAIDRFSKYKFDKMLYEVGAEQKLHFKQIFKILELMGYGWAKNCFHIDHGLYLDSDGKRFSTRKGKNVFMQDILEETKELAKKEILKRENPGKKELEERALKIALAAIYYGDLKNYRSSDVVFDIDRFVSFEGNTGPYLLYSYARAKSILRKAKFKKSKLNINSISEAEKNLILELARFSEIVNHAFENLSPNLIANYAYDISQKFNEFYHSNQVIGSNEESFRLVLVWCFSQVLKNALSLLGISVIERM